jgi:hypothetical protein
MKEDVDSGHSQIEVLGKEKAAAVAVSNTLQIENDRLRGMQSDIIKDIRVLNISREQHEGVLMHYNELQLRSAEVEAMGLNFQKMVAGAVANAGFRQSRQKPGPKKKARICKKGDPVAIGSIYATRTPCFWSRWRRNTNCSKGGPAYPPLGTTPGVLRGELVAGYRTSPGRRYRAIFWNSQNSIEWRQGFCQQSSLISRFCRTMPAPARCSATRTSFAAKQCSQLEQQGRHLLSRATL